jgi:hypothetical protein
MSAPAAKTLGPPQTTSARTRSSAIASATAASSSSHTWARQGVHRRAVDPERADVGVGIDLEGHELGHGTSLPGAGRHPTRPASVALHLGG